MSDYYCTWENGICTKCGEINPVPHIPNVLNYCNVQKQEQIKEPTFVKKTINIAKAVARVVTSSEPLIVSPETYENRLKICDDCEYKDQVKEACRKCGCSLAGKILNKAKYATESCPISKW